MRVTVPIGSDDIRILLEIDGGYLQRLSYERVVRLEEALKEARIFLKSARIGFEREI